MTRGLAHELMQQRSAHRVARLDPSDVELARELTQITGIQLDLRHEMSKDHCWVWVTQPAPNARPTAYAVAWLVGDEVQIVDLATDAAARRQGAATALLATIRTFAVENGFASLWLEVRASNAAALALYHATGFEIGRRRRAYYDDGEDALEMVLRVREV